MSVGQESPDIVYGRLLEAAHLGGYAAERVASEFKWLLTDERWKQAAGGCDDIDKFLAAINLSQYRITVEDRKEIVKLLDSARATQRAAAKALGVGQATIGRDLEPNGSKTARVVATNHSDTQASEPFGSDGNSGTPEWFQALPGDVTRPAQKHLEKKNLREERAAEHNRRKSATPVILPADRVRLICADFNEGDVADNSVDWIITDPPYPEEYLPLYPRLSSFASRVLKDGGSLLCMSGQSYLPQIYAALTERLAYHWTVAYLTPGGQSAQIFPRKINTFWKPLLWFTKGEYLGEWIGDACKSAVNDNDKRFHDWGQSESGMADIIERFTLPGQLICDPFMGGGTTGIVAVRMNRRFIGIDKDAEAVRSSEARMEEALAGMD